ncbi:cytosine deaminase [Defluviimonas sp. 20V17]|uniref:Amidohydrolase n=1 Tax=Allgaiera indica TaxID=765699 RepID=A0AAN5A0B3_9RHOB|nr:cytosine deaminase [Allgaiera indica]KDB02042.1 cytosine deaminase [Defluviimonas sp. 20V17]GHE03082.1 amidohydrolase [Allgaiera indica]SDX11746.1 cytosine deaminase [Allgaiera indica]
MDFRVLPSGAFVLRNLTTPACLLGQPGDLIPLDLCIEGGQIAAPRPGLPEVDMKGAMVFPAFIDMHTHLDKGHIWPRAANPDGSFMGALTTVGADRAAHWSPEDVRARMDFALRSAYAHGTRAIRTHLDSLPPQDAISFPVFREMRQDWRGRIELQASCLVGIDNVSGNGPYAKTADIVAASGGVLGCVTYPVADLRVRLLDFFRLAAERGLAADFHVDETGDASVATLRVIAELVLETGFDAPVTVGHCCSLAVQPEAEAFATLDLVAKAGLNVVSLPMCNMYLQDRSPGRTPRWRGVTLVHEMRARGINVSFASDNTRDPFYAYGDLDMIEVMREATRIAHLDHSRADWVQAFLTNPARACGFEAPSLAPGAPADLVISRARGWTELFARPQSDRIVLRGGRQIDRTLPDYAELDHLMRQA